MILITGGAGYIGSHLARAFHVQGIEYLVIDNLDKGNFESLPDPNRFRFGSILDKTFLEKLFVENSFHLVVHLAAEKSITKSISSPEKFFETNIRGTENLLENMALNKVHKIIFSSTAAVYGESDSPIQESNPTSPLNAYGKSKLLAENLLRDYAFRNSFQYVIFRYFNVSGASHPKYTEKNGDNIFSQISKYLEANQSVPLRGINLPTRDGSCLRDFVHVEDLVQAHFKAISYLENDFAISNSLTLNLGSGKGFTVLEVIHELEEMFGVKIPFHRVPKLEEELSSVVCNASKALEILHWSPTTNPFKFAI